MAAILDTPLGSEIEPLQQNTANTNLGGDQSAIDSAPIQPQSDITFLELETTTGIEESHRANASGFIEDQSIIGTVSTINLQQSVSDLHAWNTSDMMWQKAGQFANSDNVSQANVAHTIDAPQDSDHENYFSNFDLLSMMPKNGADFEGDFSTYLIHSGYSPSEHFNMPHQVHGNSPWVTGVR